MRNILAAVFIATASVCLEAQEAPPPPPQAVEASLPKELSCPGCNLRGANLAGRDLSNANLAGAELSEADFRGATLDGTIFIGANLTGARFDKAKLNAADLSNANLTGAVFDDATMSGVNLQHARLERASLARTTLQGVLAGPHVSLTGEPLAAVGAADDILCGYSDLTTLPKRIYVSNSGADSDSCGTTAAGACKTIQKGFARCTPTKGCGVLVMYGEYPLTETLKYEPDMHLFGGCVPRSRWKPEYFSTILAPPGGVPAIIARGVMVEKSVMQGFQVIGSKGAANGAASVAMLVRAASALHLLNNTIVAGEGGPGAAGQDSTEGTKGGDGNGRTAGTNACGAVNGGKGADVMNVNVHSKGLGFECSPSCPENNCHGYYGGGGSTGTSARGGKWGNGNCTECGSAPGQNGETAPNGLAAGCGGGGSASPDNAGTFSDTTWSGSVASKGDFGGRGGGGGGGGSGGYRGIWCFWVITENAGNSGGGGGAGGCPPPGGTGGQQGGGSFAILTKITQLHMDHCRIVGARGGTGGRGGNGAKGGAGGKGAGGASGGNAGTGGGGGNGGPGGSSGGGAGGNGGPSVLIAMLQESTLDVKNTAYYGGSSGTPGAHGIGGPKADGGDCTGTNGAAGVNGVVADTRKY